VKKLVDILAEHYDRIVAQIQRESRLYAILMCGEIVYDQRGAKPRKVVRILCDSDDANFILESTKTLCPEATKWVKKSIARRRPR
jgi:hypothetical protein